MEKPIDTKKNLGDEALEGMRENIHSHGSRNPVVSIPEMLLIRIATSCTLVPGRGYAASLGCCKKLAHCTSYFPIFPWVSKPADLRNFAMGGFLSEMLVE